jgi:hypothetical protein
MKKQIVSFSVLIILTLIPYHCSAMETTPNFIPLNNGLLTEIEAKIAQTAYVGYFTSNRSITGTTIKKDTVVNLLRYQRNLDNSKGAGPYELFCPIVVKKTDDLIQNLGQFDPNQHKEAKEAIRQKRAVYCPLNQGVIIYSLTQQPNIETENIKGLIEQFQKDYSNNVIIPLKKMLISS